MKVQKLMHSSRMRARNLRIAITRASSMVKLGVLLFLVAVGVFRFAQDNESWSTSWSRSKKVRAIAGASQRAPTVWFSYSLEQTVWCDPFVI